MKPIKFKGHNLVLAENQEEYHPLPVCDERTPEGTKVSCWQLTWKERILILFTGRLFISQFTFGHSYQPILPMTDWEEPKCLNCGSPIGDHKAKHGFHCPRTQN
jgi:hypothetical protein